MIDDNVEARLVNIAQFLDSSTCDIPPEEAGRRKRMTAL